jgi:hypothetical protein
LTDPAIRKLYHSLRKKYRIYTREEKQSAIKLFDLELAFWTTNPPLGAYGWKNLRNGLVRTALQQVVVHLVSLEPYERVTVRMIRMWLEQRDHGKELKRRGPKVNIDFQEEVWAHIILAVIVVDVASGVESIKLKSNITHSYDIVRMAAQETQKKLHWMDDEKVQGLKFSNKWVRGFLLRDKFSRKKVTTEVKNPPSEAEVRRIMKDRQDSIVDNLFHEDLKSIGNMDETAFRYAIGPTHQFTSKSIQRPTGIPKTSDKVRITACVTALADGKQLPLLSIIKHSVSSKDRPDQSGMTVVKNLFHKTTVSDYPMGGNSIYGSAR